MNAQDIMTRDVISAMPSTTVREVATLMADNKISAVPILDDVGRLVGIVRESDLCHRAEISTKHKRKWWERIFYDNEMLAQDYVKEHGVRAEDIMSKRIPAVSPDSELLEIADVLDFQKVRLVPVLQDGQIVGIVSRSDLVKALSQADIDASNTSSNDTVIKNKIYRELRAQPWLPPEAISVTIKDGVADLWGSVDSVAQRKAIKIIVEGVPDVRTLRDHLQVYPQNLVAD